MSNIVTDIKLPGLFAHLNCISELLQKHNQGLDSFAESIGPGGAVQKNITEIINLCERETRLQAMIEFQNALMGLFIKFLRNNPEANVFTHHSFFQFIMKFDFSSPVALAELENYRNQFDRDIEEEGNTPIYSEGFLYDQSGNEVRV